MGVVNVAFGKIINSIDSEARWMGAYSKKELYQRLHDELGCRLTRAGADASGASESKDDSSIEASSDSARGSA